MMNGTISARGPSAFVVTLIFVALAGLALSPLMMSIRSSLWLGPQTLAFGVAGAAAGLLFAFLAYRQATAGFLDTATTWRWYVPLVIVGAPLISLLVLRFAFHAFPSTGDEYGYVFQADTLAHGRLVNPPPPDPQLFEQVYLIASGDRWVGQYLPGWPAIIAAVQTLRLPAWSAAPLVGLALLLLMWGSLKRECASPALAGALLTAYAASAFFILNGATYYSHCAAAASVVGTVYCLIRSERDNSPLWPILAGIGVGMALLCRLDSFLLAGLAAFCAWLEQRGRMRLLLYGLLGLLPMAALFGAYNYYITGSPIVLPTVWAGNLHIGMSGVEGVEDWAGRPRVLIQTTWRLGELADTASLLLPAFYCAALVMRLRNRSFRFYDALPVANLILFTIFPDLGGFQIGPRYWFDGFAIMHLTVGSAFGARGPAWRRFIVAACLLLAAFSLARLPAQIDYYARIGNERASVYRLAAALPQDRHHVVLVQSFKSAWNERFAKDRMNRSVDFDRNGIDFDGPVLFGRADLPDSVERACRLFPNSDIEIFSLDHLHPDGILQPAACE